MYLILLDLPHFCSQLCFYKPVQYSIETSFLFDFAGDNIGWADLFGQALENSNPVDQYLLSECCKSVCVCSMYVYMLKYVCLVSACVYAARHW